MIEIKSTSINLSLYLLFNHRNTNVLFLNAGVHLRSESELNVESWGISSVHTPESTLVFFLD